MDWVGSSACADCHPTETKLWRGSHHDLAMQPATDTTVLGDFDDTVFTHRGFTTTFFRRDGVPWVRTDGPEGELADFRIAYTFGVAPLQQYLIELDDGRLQALSVCWDTRPAEQGGQRWFHLYPDEAIDHRDVLHWTAPSQRWNSMCSACHSTGVEKRYEPSTGRFATRFAEIDVACEACHGPGSRHVAWATDGIGEAPGLLVDLRSAPAGWTLAADRQTAKRSQPRREHTEIELCARCHARRAQLGDFGHRHGRPLADTHRLALLDEGLYHADGQIRDEVYVYGSFRQSAMYREGVTCSDCHDPHSGRLRAAGNALCSTCHRPDVFDSTQHHGHPAGSEGAQCVSCHMPTRDYMVVDPRRDHSFRVPRPDLSLRLGTPNACNGCHHDRDAAWAATQIADQRRRFPTDATRESSFHYGEALHAARTWQADGGDLLRRTIDDPAMPAIARATALTLLPRYPSPSNASIVERALHEDDPLVRRAAAETLTSFDPKVRWRLGETPLSDPMLTVRLAATRTLASSVPSPINDSDSSALGLLAAGFAEDEDVQRFHADSARGLVNRAWLYRVAGNSAAAEATYRTAVARRFPFVPGYINLADLLYRQRLETEAEATIRRGIVRVPEAGALWFGLGLSLVRQGRLDEALAALEHSVALQPEEPHFRYTYGVALHGAGNVEAAVEALTEGQGRFPAHRPTLGALARFHQERGERATALRFARRLVALAPQDFEAQQLVAELD